VDNGNGSAYTGLGELYFYGQGVQVDKERAKQYYMIASEKGISVAAQWFKSVADNLATDVEDKKLYSLMYGSCLYNGTGVRKNYDTAYTYLSQSGLPEASYMIGMMFMEESYERKSPKTAFDWFQRSALEGGSPKAYKMMNVAYEAAGGDVEVCCVTELRTSI